MKHLIRFGLLACLIVTRHAMATDYYVNPIGNDEWSGTTKAANSEQTNGPFKTLERAKQAIRGLKKADNFTDKVTVNIAGGVYILKQPLHFSLMDTGLPGREILWQGEQGSLVTISAGLPLICRKRNTTFWDCPVKPLPVNTTFYDTGRIKGNGPKFELFVNDQKLELARWPDKDWAHIKLPIDTNSQFSVMETLPALTGTMTDAQVHIFAGNDWYDQYLGVNSVDASGNAIKLSAATGYPLASGRRFYIQNLPSLLNVPGEWFYEAATQKISFIAPIGSTPKEVMLTSLPNIILADGISNITFKNISFQHSAGTAITVKNSNNIVMDNLDVNSIGGKGVDINGGQNVQLINSKIHHTGSAAVAVSGGDRDTLKSSGHLIHNNYIHHMSTVIMTYTPGIEVSGVGIKATHNLLEQGPHAAITITGNDHLIEKNEIHHFCLQASDCGAIYTGRNWSWRGNVVRSNYLHDIIGSGMTSLDLVNNQVIYAAGGAVGVYLDDGVSGFEISSNIFENAGTMALQIGGGRDNTITNNVFITNDYAIFLDNRWPTYNWDNMQSTLDASPYKTAIWQQKYPALSIPMINKSWPEGNRIERNIIVSTKPGGLSLRYQVPTNSTVIADNIVWSTTAKPTVDYKILDMNKDIGGAPWAQWIAEGIEKNSLVADPCVTIAVKKMTACSGSPANKIGFTPLATDIGLLP
ncbi:MAG: right-handed parallel beta-helix repeat-containing protein [Methylococcaceae bacterium]